MYTFDDRDGSSLTLRPEATAGIVRSVIEQNLANTDPGPQGLGHGSHVPSRATAEGAPETVPSGGRGGLRPREPHHGRRDHRDGSGVSRTLWAGQVRARHQLRRRRHLPAGLRREPSARCFERTFTASARTVRGARRPIRCRVLDSKAPEEQELIESLPRIADFLSAECRDHFDEVRRQLELLGHTVPGRPPAGARARLLRQDHLRGGLGGARGSERRPRWRAVRRPRQGAGRTGSVWHRIRRRCGAARHAAAREASRKTLRRLPHPSRIPGARSGPPAPASVADGGGAEPDGHRRGAASSRG